MLVNILLCIGMYNIYFFKFIIYFRICVVPISFTKFRAFIDINCPLSRCPKSKYLVKTVCDVRRSLSGNTEIREKFDKVGLSIFDKKEPSMLMPPKRR